MTQVKICYDSETHRIKQSYWGDGVPSWASQIADGEVVATIETTQDRRIEAINSALNSVEAGVDYDENTETPIPRLCYDPDADELYAEVDIQPLLS